MKRQMFEYSFEYTGVKTFKAYSFEEAYQMAQMNEAQIHHIACYDSNDPKVTF
jgi:hypothetical protein